MLAKLQVPHSTHLEAQAGRCHDGRQPNANQLPEDDRLRPSAAHTASKHCSEHGHWGNQVADAGSEETDCEDCVGQGGEAVDSTEGVGDLADPSLGWETDRQ